MIKKRLLTIMLIVALVFTNASVVFATENINTSSGPSIEDPDEGTSGGGVGDNPTGGAVEEKTTEAPVKALTTIVPEVKAVASTYNVKLIDSAGKAKLVQGYSTLAKANTALNNIYSGADTTFNVNFDKALKGNVGLVVTNKAGRILNMKHGMAYVKSSRATVTIGSTYVTPNTPLHFFSGNGENTTIGISGVKISIATSKLMLVPASVVNREYKSGYSYRKDYYTKSSNGDLYHYTYKIYSPNSSSTNSSGNVQGKTSAYSGFVVDKAPSWMKVGGKYYSNDGINYYTNIGLSTKAGTYYPYYKFLPFRNRSNYNYSNLNSWITKNTKSNSKLRSQGSNLINSQDRYGVNAVMELAFACLESGYGTSSYALKRNNLFGINAVDSNPSRATYFSSAGNCIAQHTYRYLSRGYGDAKTDGRYFGLTPGNKAVGTNVKYASDPWHGEKISGLSYRIDKALGSKDYRKYTVGVTINKSTPVYKSPGKTQLYNLSNKSKGAGPAGIPVIILGSSGSYYLIQSDLPVSGNYAKYSYTYYYNKSIAYVKKSSIKVVSSGKQTYTNKIKANRDLRSLTVKVGTKNYLAGFNPAKTSYTLTVPKKTTSVKIAGTPLMTTSKVTGNGTKRFKCKYYNIYYVKVKSGTGVTKTIKLRVNRAKK